MNQFMGLNEIEHQSSMIPMLPVINYNHIPNLPPVPDQFCGEFYEYDRNSYAKRTNNNKRKFDKVDTTSDLASDELHHLSAAELKRQFHIQSEQKRRAHIKDGFNDLKEQLPHCSQNHLSKASLLNKAVIHIKHLKSTQAALLAEIDRLNLENNQLRMIQSALYPTTSKDHHLTTTTTPATTPHLDHHNTALHHVYSLGI